MRLLFHFFVSDTMMLLVVLSCVVAVCLGEETSVSEHWHRSKFPNPFDDTEKDTHACGRGMKSWVCDPNNILKEGDGMLRLYNSIICKY